MKRDLPPTTPYREKQRAKKTRPGFFSDSLRPRAYARARYREAGAAAYELASMQRGKGETPENFFQSAFRPMLAGLQTRFRLPENVSVLPEISLGYMGARRRRGSDATAPVNNIL